MIEISARDARRVLLLEQGLLGDPGRQATPAAVVKIVRQLGFVQLGSIPVAWYAHRRHRSPLQPVHCFAADREMDDEALGKLEDPVLAARL